jgi:hypothetical protein
MRQALNATGTTITFSATYLEVVHYIHETSLDGGLLELSSGSENYDSVEIPLEPPSIFDLMLVRTFIKK